LNNFFFMPGQKQLKDFLLQSGFNLSGICNIRSYNQSVPENYKIPATFPETGSIIIFGSGGKYFWEIFKNFQESPQGIFLKNNSDPIDQYSEFIAERIREKFPDLNGKYIFPFKKTDLLIDFQKLAVCAGLGHFSPIIKLVLHPVYGSWVSLRGTIITKQEYKPTGPLLTPVPCTDCSRPCLGACPVQAVTSEKFDFHICATYRNQETDCQSHCHVRRACIIGPEHAYTNEEGLHRNKSSLETIRAYYKLKKNP
jgi:ferredoxin